MHSSLRLKLLLSHLCLIILAMGLAGFLLLTFLQRYFLQATEESLAAQARITAQTLIPGALTAGPPVEMQAPLSNALQQRQAGNLALQTQNLALPTGDITLSDFDLGYLADSSIQLGAQLETRIRVLDTTGTVLVDSSGESGGQILTDDPLVVKALQGEYGSSTTEAGRETLMVVAMPVMIEEGLAGVVYLTQPLHDVDAVLADLRTRWVWSTAIALALSGIVALLLSRAITRPLRRLTTAAGAIAQGQFDQQVPVRSQDELGRLTRTFNDMTTRLRSARQTQTAFVANVSHELRTPLTAIKGMVETLRDGAVDDNAVRDQFLETVETETDRLIRLVNDLLVLTRADAEGLNLRREPLDMAELARTTIEGFAPRAASRHVAVTLGAEPAAPLAWADGDRVAQVLVNLLDNAIKYSHPGGTVAVRVTHQNDMALVVVQDTGIGISAGDLPQIGQRFYRADKARARERATDDSRHLENSRACERATDGSGPPANSRARERASEREGYPDHAQSGSGLGLSIAVALVEAHGGRLWINSAEGVGTTVSFTLPAA